MAVTRPPSDFQQLLERGPACIANVFAACRGEIPSTERELEAARETLLSWLLLLSEEAMPLTKEVKAAHTRIAALDGDLGAAMSNLFAHVFHHFDYVHRKCEEMHERHGRGALVIRVHHLTQAKRRVVVDWTTLDDLKKACAFSYWAAMQYDRRNEVVVCVCFTDTSETRFDTRLQMWRARIVDRDACAKEAAAMKLLAPVPFRPWVPLDAKDAPFAIVCIGCGKRVSKYAKRCVCSCGDALFCSIVCQVSAYLKGHKEECFRTKALRDEVNRCVRLAHPLAHYVNEGVLPPHRCPHEWDVTVK
eukprot:jgi/Mesvir1/10350/Mv10551-RA.1